MIPESLTNAALHLKAVERLKLVEILLNSLDKTDSQVEKKWADESDKRYEAYKDGRLESKSFDEIEKRFQSWK